MARDRQRAKQRKARRPQQGGGGPARPEDGDGLTPEPDALHRENVPGPVDHLGEADQFEAALVAGAGGVPETDPESVEEAELEDTYDERDPDVELERAAVATGRPGAVERREAHAPAHGRGGGRFVNFLRASWAELQRVQWPDRRQVGQATLVVLGFVLFAGAFLGFADYVAKQLVDLII